jgi:hypothetical protein
MDEIFEKRRSSNCHKNQLKDQVVNKYENTRNQ